MDATKVATKYAQDVVAGRIVACHWTRLACRRHLDDLKHRTARGLVWKAVEAQHAVDFIHQHCRHIKGRWRGQAIRLEPWQVFAVVSLFGWYRKGGKDDKRRFRRAYLEVARKNAKSTLMAAITLYMLVADGEPGPEVYAFATTYDQASIVFEAARQMVLLSPRLRRLLDPRAHAVVDFEMAGTLKPLHAKSSTQDGLNVHCAVADELHAHRDATMWDVIDSATGAREQPMVLAITTAGSNRAGICYEQRDYLCKVLEGSLADDDYWGIIYTIDPEDDWEDPTCWPKANPNLDVSVYRTDLESLARKASQAPARQANFLTKRLNVWVGAMDAYYTIADWEACADAALKLDDFAGLPCFMGLDLATKRDLSSLVIVFLAEDGMHYVFTRFWLPTEAVERGSAYEGWVRSGHIRTTPGDVTDFDEIEDEVRALFDQLNHREVAFDPWQATQMAGHLLEDGLPMVEVRPTVQNFSFAMKETDALLAQRRVRHDGNPVMEWCVSNVVAKLDKKDNVFPNKEFPQNKIDGVVAWLTAECRALVYQEGDDGLVLWQP